MLSFGTCFLLLAPVKIYWYSLVQVSKHPFQHLQGRAVWYRTTQTGQEEMGIRAAWKQAQVCVAHWFFFPGMRHFSVHHRTASQNAYIWKHSIFNLSRSVTSLIFWQFTLQGDCNSDWSRNNWLHGYGYWAVSVTTKMVEAVAVLSSRVYLPLELNCGMAFVGIHNLLLLKVRWHNLTYCSMYFELILADLLLKKIRNTCTSLSASSTLMVVPSSRKTVMSTTSTKVMLNNSTAQ